MKLVGLCNQSREVFSTPEGTMSAIAAARAIDIDRGSEVFKPQYVVVAELAEGEDGYLVFEVDDAVDVEGDSDALREQIAGASCTCVRARYTL